MSPVTGRDPYQLALAALDRFAADGRFGWGSPLVVTALAQELALSPTPVREALARLAGEGVIEHRPGRGYFAPSPGPGDIAELYELHHRLVAWALDENPSGPWRRPGGAAPEGSRQERIFADIVNASGVHALRAEHRRLVRRLHPVQSVEARVRPLSKDRLDRLEAGAAGRNVVRLRQEIARYHLERKQVSNEVFLAMRRPEGSI